MKRYQVQARRDEGKNWSMWTEADTYKRAKEHADRIDQLGYMGRIYPTAEGVETLWEILQAHGVDDVTGLTDAILDAGFCVQEKGATDER